MTQYVINIGAMPNDGTGDPLRTAFNETNLNFDQVFAAGPVLSNVRIANNTILTTTTNGNLVLAPNGIGRIQANATIVPSVANVRDLGSATQRWGTVYTQYINISSGTTVNGDLTVDGNLTVQGNIIQVGNIVTETLTIQLANAATTASAANGAGITVGANDNIATLLYNSSNNVWTTNIGISSVGNVTAPYFFGNISLANGFPATYGNANVVANLSALGSNPVSTTGNVTGAYIKGNGSELTSLPAPVVTQDITSNGAMSIMTYDGNIKYVNYATVEPSSGNIAGGNIATTGLVSATGNITSGNLVSPTLNNSGNISVVAGGNTWTFGSTGTTIFPTLTVTRGDRTGNLTGQTLLFGDATQEALISTPNGDANANPNSQRFVINPGAGAANTTGEGGDIYLYAGRGGDAGGSGGDIKIRGGLGPVDGAGGYITMEGGEADADGVGGYIEIFGGQSGNAAGGSLYIQGGQGLTGGDANVMGGFGAAGPGGDVSIIGGASANGQAEYGNIIVATGSKNWTFNNTGNLVLPQGGVVYETGIPFGGLEGNTIALKPSGGIDADQQLLIYPTVVPGTDDNHLHLTTGNLYNTELFLGNDNLYVKLSNTGNVVINSNDDTGNSAQWTFGNTGNLTLPSGGNLIVSGAIVGSGASPAPSLSGFSSVNAIALSASGNVTGGNILTDNYFYANGSPFVSSNYGNANVAANLATFGSNPISTTGNITAGNFVGNGAALSNVTVSVAGNIVGTQPNVTLVAGSYSTVFDNTGLTTFPGNVTTSGTFIGSGAGLTGVALKTTGAWTVASGTNTYSITVPANGAYQMWVRGNIPNGIITYLATISVTNTNVPVLGTQRAYNYTGGGSPILLVTMPTQIIGAEGTISTAVISGTTNNVFDFVISNTSGSPQLIFWGYVTLS